MIKLHFLGGEIKNKQMIPTSTKMIFQYHAKKGNNSKSDSHIQNGSLYRIDKCPGEVILEFGSRTIRDTFDSAR